MGQQERVEQEPNESQQQQNDSEPFQEQLRELLNQHRHVINAEDRLHPRQDVYNIRVSETFTFDTLIDRLKRIYQQQRNAFKIDKF